MENEERKQPTASSTATCHVLSPSPPASEAHVTARSVMSVTLWPKIHVHSTEQNVSMDSSSWHRANPRVVCLSLLRRSWRPLHPALGNISRL